MRNKKGFTLIELLAVIIILGILMTVAVVGVTRYINDSRRSTYATSSEAFLNAVMTKVNANKIHANQVGTLFLVPVSTDKAKSCVALEKGGKSPFSDSWTYAYVGVKYNGNDNDYFYVSMDGASHAINFATSAELQDQGGKLIVTGTDITKVDELGPSFGETKEFFVGTGTAPTGATNGSASLKDMATKAGGISTVKFVGTSECLD